MFDASLETSVKLVQQNKWTGGIQRDFTTPEKNLLRAYELDPRYVGTIARLIVWYDSNRQYDKKSKIIDQALAAGVQSEYFSLAKAYIPLNARGDTAPVRI